MNRGQLVSVISNDWMIRFVSLFLAVVLWFFAGGEDRIDKNVMVPVEIINLPQNLVISNQYKKEIEVSVSGPRSIITGMDRGVIRQVDLAKALPGTLVVKNTNDTISVPRGVSVKRVQPASIILSLDKLIKKDVPIAVRTIGRVEKDFFLKSKKTSPDIISLTGPDTVLQQVEKIFTHPVNLTGMSSSSSFQVPLELSPQMVDLIGETSVTVKLEVVPDSAPATIENVSVEGYIDDLPVVVEPAVVKVLAVIPKVALARKQEISSLIRAVARGKSGEEVLSVAIQAQREDMPVEIVSVTPQQVRVKDGASVIRNTNKKKKKK